MSKLTFEIEISTMHKTKEQCIEMLKKENIHCDCIIINQCDINAYEEINFENQCIRIFFTTERGVSKSRDMALRNIKADIMALGDDDLFYYDNFDKIILDYYKNNPKADAVIFNIDDCYKTFSNKSRKCFFLELSGYKSMQITFKRKLNNGVNTTDISFNEYFGTGSDNVQSGEENIFLADLWRKGAKIFYSKDKLLKREKSKSSWFKDYTENFLKDRGAIYWEISHLWYPLYIIRFVIKNRKKIRKNYSLFQALKFIHTGRTEYINSKHASMKK